jgi:uncharacterized membrane protein YgdD (TMEM256/DUF423 family)
MHAPALLAVGLFARSRRLRAGGIVLLLGLLVFAGDLLMRDYAETRLFTMAAPAGGVLMMLGWITVAVSALGRRPASH